MSLSRRDAGEARGGRTRAREVVFRTLFEADISSDDPLEVLELALGRFRFTPDSRRFAQRLGESLSDRLPEIDALLAGIVQNWSLERLSGVVRAVLRLGVAELLCIPESPARVILNESVRLAVRYADDEAGGFVNGVLDAAARRTRPEEMARDGRES